MIEAKNLSWRAGAKSILDGIDFRLAPNSVTAIIGPNGSGKSTLMKCLVGVLRPDSGEVCLDGAPLSTFDLEALAKRRAFLAQGHAIDFPFTVTEVVLMGRHPHAAQGHSKGPQNDTRRALEYTDTWHLRDRLFPTLSGGEQQRVQIARVLTQIQDLDDAYLFLDEPTSALDLKHQFMVFELLHDLARDQRMSICVILHDVRLARRYADQAVMLKDGRVFASGATGDVMTPENVAGLFEISTILARDIVAESN